MAVKRRNVHGDGARAGTGADEDVHAEVFERGVDHLFDIGKQPMDFVDEEDFAVLDIAEDADEVEFLLENRAGGLLEADAEFLADDVGKSGFAEAGRARRAGRGPSPRHGAARLRSRSRGFL